MKEQKWTQEQIKELILTNDRMVYRSLMMLYSKQTSYEQTRGQTTDRNGVGFNHCDAEIMTSFAKFLEKTGFLTPKQKVIARKKLIKYVKQLTRYANEEVA